MRTERTTASPEAGNPLADRVAFLERELQLSDQLVQLVARELRGPLTPIVLNLDALMSDRDTLSKASRQRGAIERLQQNMQRFLARADLLLSAADVRQGQLRPTGVPLEVRPILKRVLTSQRLQFGSAHPAIRLSANVNAIVRFDAAVLEQIVDNLVSNALRYGAGPIDVILRVTDRDAEVRVHDCGRGIATEHLESLFELFGQREAGPTAGFGVALWTGRQLARAMDGDLTLEHSSANGATFLLTLPLDRSSG